MQCGPEVRIRTVILLSLFYDAHRYFAVKLLLEWNIRDLNPGPPRYERGALTNGANGPEREDSFRSIPKLLQFLATSCNKGSLRLSADRRELG